MTAPTAPARLRQDEPCGLIACWPGADRSERVTQILSTMHQGHAPPAPRFRRLSEPLPADRARAGEQSSASGHGARRNLPSIRRPVNAVATAKAQAAAGCCGPAYLSIRVTRLRGLHRLPGPARPLTGVREVLSGLLGTGMVGAQHPFGGPHAGVIGTGRPSLPGGRQGVVAAGGGCHDALPHHHRDTTPQEIRAATVRPPQTETRRSSMSGSRRLSRSRWTDRTAR